MSKFMTDLLADLEADAAQNMPLLAANIAREQKAEALSERIGANDLCDLYHSGDFSGHIVDHLSGLVSDAYAWVTHWTAKKGDAWLDAQLADTPARHWSDPVSTDSDDDGGPEEVV